MADDRSLPAKREERAKEAAKAWAEEARRVADLSDRSAKLRAVRMAQDGEPGVVANRPKAEHPVRKSALVREK
jgi:hypothetical protein